MLAAGDAHDQFTDSAVIGLFHAGTDNEIAAFRIEFPEYPQRLRVETVRVDLAFKGSSHSVQSTGGSTRTTFLPVRVSLNFLVAARVRA